MAEALNPALYFLPVADRDCVVELLLPPPAAELRRRMSGRRSRLGSL
jgi:hypothetical protein